MNHSVLIIEMCLLSLLARFAYRRPEPDPGTALTKNGTQAIEKYKKDNAASETESGTAGHYRSYDNQAMSLDIHSVEN